MRPVTPDMHLNEDLDRNRGNLPTYDGMENFDQSDGSSTPRQREPQCLDQKVNVNMQKYHLDNDRLIKFPND